MRHIYIKAIISLILCLGIHINSKAQVKTKTFYEGIPTQLIPNNKSIIPEKGIAAPDEFIELLNQAKSESENLTEYSSRFGIPAEVDLDILANAKETEEKNIATFAITINAEKALNISLQFNQFFLSEHSVLSIYTQNELTDSITAKENNDNKVWATRVYQGSKLTIVLRLPIEEKEKVALRINHVNFGFRKFGGEYFGNPGASADCNINAVCPEGNGWQNERNSVALIVANGVEVCTGSLIMNTCNTNVPYLLTANHCLAAGNVPNWVFQFQTWSATCTGNSGWREDIQFNGCTLRANSIPSDFALLQLNQTPQPTSGIFYSGWSRNGAVPNGSISLHHPRGDLMKFSRDLNASGISSWGGVNNHWFDLFDQGIVQTGSSGAPLFDLNHRIVGQLHGYQANTCQPTDNACFCTHPHVGEYGRFDISWTGGGTNATRLSYWLDPSNSGAITTNTTNIANLFTAPIAGSFLPITGNGVVCGTTQTYTITGVVPGATVVWVLTGPTAGSYIVPLQNVCTLLANGTQATLTKVNSGNVHLSATITNCNGVIQYAGKDIAFGVPPIYYNGGYWTNSHYQPICCTGDPTNATYVPVLLVSSNNQYTWQKTGGSSNATWSQPTNWSANITFSSPVNPGNFIQYNITTANSCGSRSDPLYISYNGPPMFAISPNPVSSELNIESVVVNNIYDERDNSQNYRGIDKVQVIDKMGNVVLRKSYPRNAKKVNLNVSSLHSDVYVVRVFNGKASEEHKIIVQH